MAPQGGGVVCGGAAMAVAVGVVVEGGEIDVVPYFFHDERERER